MSKIQKLDNLVVVQVNVNIWSGQTKLRPEDFRLGVGGSLPPEKVALLGTKKLVDTYNLRPFSRVKQRINRKLSAIGIEFLNGYAVPVDKVDEATLLLEQSKEEFQLEKQKFVQNYFDLVDSWAKENPDLESSIRESALSQAEVESKLGFDYQMFQINPLANEALNAKMNASVENLGTNLLAEVAKQADEFYKSYFLGRDQVGIRTQDTLRNIRNRLDGLSFLDSRINPLVGLLDQSLEVYKQASGGRHVGQPFLMQIIGAILILSDVKRMEEFIKGQVTMDSAAAAAGSGSFVHTEDDTLLSVGPSVSGEAQSSDATVFFTEESSSQGSSEAVDAEDIASIEAFFGQSATTREAEGEETQLLQTLDNVLHGTEVSDFTQSDQGANPDIHEATESSSASEDENLFF